MIFCCFFFTKKSHKLLSLKFSFFFETVVDAARLKQSEWRRPRIWRIRRDAPYQCGDRFIFQTNAETARFSRLTRRRRNQESTPREYGGDGFERVRDDPVSVRVRHRNQSAMTINGH